MMYKIITTNPVVSISSMAQGIQMIRKRNNEIERLNIIVDRLTKENKRLRGL